MNINNIDLLTPTPLCEIFHTTTSDKGGKNIETQHHNYTIVYYNLFKDIQLHKLNIFELGIGGTPGIKNGGGSLRAWKSFFINSDIYGGDIDSLQLFTEDRITTFLIDQTNSTSIHSCFYKLPNFDIIIDDGQHTLSANKCFFENSIHKLKSGGYFIIEDIPNFEIDNFNKQIKLWTKEYSELTFELLNISSPTNNFDNNLLIIKK
jgi:hypothetical protein